MKMLVPLQSGGLPRAMSDGEAPRSLCAEHDRTEFWLTSEERALLVALYDKMGSGRITAATFLDGRFSTLDRAYDGLVDLGLIEGCPAGKGQVDIALTDFGMVIANDVQDGFQRTSGMLVFEAPELPVVELPVVELPIIEIQSCHTPIYKPVWTGNGDDCGIIQYEEEPEMRKVRALGRAWACIRQAFVGARHVFMRWFAAAR